MPKSDRELKIVGVVELTVSKHVTGVFKEKVVAHVKLFDDRSRPLDAMVKIASDEKVVGNPAPYGWRIGDRWTFRASPEDPFE